MEITILTSLWYLMLNVYVCPLQATIKDTSECVLLSAQLDTGAVGTSISSYGLKKMEQTLGYKLHPIGTTTVVGVNSGLVEVPAYRFNVMIMEKDGGKVFIKNVTMTNDDIGTYEDMEGNEKPLDVLVGMDILNQFDYVIDNKTNHAHMSLYYPKLQQSNFKPTETSNVKPNEQQVSKTGEPQASFGEKQDKVLGNNNNNRSGSKKTLMKYRKLKGKDNIKLKNPYKIEYQEF